MDKLSQLYSLSASHSHIVQPAGAASTEQNKVDKTAQLHFSHPDLEDQNSEAQLIFFKSVAMDSMKMLYVF